MAPGTRRARGLAYAEHDDLEGLPVRQWREGWVNVAPQAPEVTKPNDIWGVELPYGLPKDSTLLPPHAQELLRAARSGVAYKRPPPDDPDEGDPDVGSTVLLPDKPAKNDDDDDAEAKGFATRTWRQVPRPLESASPPSHLAKRRKGTVTLPSRYAASAPAGQTATKATVRRIDAAGNPYTQEVTLVEGQPVDGEIISTSFVIVPIAPQAAGAAGAVAQQPTSNRRRPPLPKKKGRGPGRGRKKKLLVPESRRPAPVDRAVQPAATQPKVETETVAIELKPKTEDTPSQAEAGNNDDEDEGDGDGDDGDEDGDEEGDAEGGDEGDTQIDDSMGPMDQDLEMADASSTSKPASQSMSSTPEEGIRTTKRSSPPGGGGVGGGGGHSLGLALPLPLAASSVSPRVEGSPLKNVVVSSPTEISPQIPSAAPMENPSAEFATTAVTATVEAALAPQQTLPPPPPEPSLLARDADDVDVVMGEGGDILAAQDTLAEGQAATEPERVLVDLEEAGSRAAASELSVDVEMGGLSESAPSEAQEPVNPAVGQPDEEMDELVNNSPDEPAEQAPGAASEVSSQLEAMVESDAEKTPKQSEETEEPEEPPEKPEEIEEPEEPEGPEKPKEPEEQKKLEEPGEPGDPRETEEPEESKGAQERKAFVQSEEDPASTDVMDIDVVVPNTIKQESLALATGTVEPAANSPSMQPMVEGPASADVPEDVFTDAPTAMPTASILTSVPEGTVSEVSMSDSLADVKSALENGPSTEPLSTEAAAAPGRPEGGEPVQSLTETASPVEEAAEPDTGKEPGPAAQLEKEASKGGEQKEEKEEKQEEDQEEDQEEQLEEKEPKEGDLHEDQPKEDEIKEVAAPAKSPKEGTPREEALNERLPKEEPPVEELPKVALSRENSPKVVLSSKEEASKGNSPKEELSKRLPGEEVSKQDPPPTAPNEPLDNLTKDSPAEVTHQAAEPSSLGQDGVMVDMDFTEEVKAGPDASPPTTIALPITAEMASMATPAGRSPAGPTPTTPLAIAPPIEPADAETSPGAGSDGGGIDLLGRLERELERHSGAVASGEEPSGERQSVHEEAGETPDDKGAGKGEGDRQWETGEHADERQKRLEDERRDEGRDEDRDGRHEKDTNEHMGGTENRHEEDGEDERMAEDKRKDEGEAMDKDGGKRNAEEKNEASAKDESEGNNARNYTENKVESEDMHEAESEDVPVPVDGI